MEHKKDLGKLIKDRLANAEAEPNDALWGTIEKTLEQKRKRKVRFIWFWSGLGIILGILLLSYLVTPKAPGGQPTSTLPNNQVASPSEKQDASQPSSKENPEYFRKATNEKQAKKGSSQTNSAAEKNALASDTQTKQKPSSKHQSLSGNLTGTSNKNNGERIPEKEGIPKNNLGESVEANASNTKRKNKTSKNNDPNRKMGQDSLKNGLVQMQTDSLTNKKKFLKKPKEEEEKINDVLNPSKWLLSIHAIPNYYTYLSSGTPYDASLSTGNLSGRFSLSYGILINIPLSQKITFRFGYRRSNFKYIVQNTISGLANTGTAEIFTDEAIVRNGSMVPVPLQEAINNGERFGIEQQLGYNEIPFEVSYSILQNDLSVDAIGGISPMLLGKNSINFQNVTGSGVIGSGSYLKKTAFSANFGIGIRYQLLEKVRLDVEPTMRYQFNAFDTRFQNLHPFIFSISVGATLKL